MNRDQPESSATASSSRLGCSSGSGPTRVLALGEGGVSAATSSGLSGLGVSGFAGSGSSA